MGLVPTDAFFMLGAVAVGLLLWIAWTVASMKQTLDNFCGSEKSDDSEESDDEPSPVRGNTRPD